MKKLFLLGLLLASPALAGDFFSTYDSLFAQESLCDASIPGQAEGESGFKAMYAILKRDDFQQRKSDVEITGEGAYFASLRSRSSGQECTIVQHEDCYSAYCSR